ncbi:GNAT family N-acetyltransferase [Halocatena halophila]|uniref:GNAT family N-acetyltransferase n=1 Tax=Halocatena halophila TaxID=2814576 RepID=UPI002ED377D7
MEYRPAVAADLRSIRTVASAGWHAAYDEILGQSAVETTVETWYSETSLQSRIESADNEFLVGADAGEIIGFVDGGPTSDGPCEAAVSALYVHPDRWNEGIGSALLERLFKRFQSAGYDDVWLAVLEDNAVGRAFYESHDFEVHRRQSTELPAGSAIELLLTHKL